MTDAKGNAPAYEARGAVQTALAASQHEEDSTPKGRNSRGGA